MTHWMVEIDVWNSAPSVGMATLTMVASRIAMIIPITTTPPRMMTSRSRPVRCACMSVFPPFLIRL